MSDDQQPISADGTNGAEPQADTAQAQQVQQAQLEVAIARYRELVAAQPGLVPELVRGDTIEEIDASVEQARRTYRQISQRIVEQYERQVLTGNPPRSSAAVGVEWLRPEAKIALGLRSIQ